MARNDVQRRASLLAFGLALCAFAWVLVRFPPARYGFYPVCPFHAWTGLLCPGCGGTRAVAALLRGHLAEAWRLNGLVMTLLPFGFCYGLVVARRVWRQEQRVWMELPAPVWGILGVATGVFGVVRNLG